MKPLPNVNMSPADCNALRNWASSYGAALRQRTVRQKTTMARHGTLPEFMYQRQCEILDKPVSIQGLKGEVLGALERGAQSLFLLGAQKKMLILAKWSPRVQPWVPRAPAFLSWSSGALYFYPGVWSPKPLWDPVHCLWRASQYSRRCRCRTHCRTGRRRSGRIWWKQRWRSWRSSGRFHFAPRRDWKLCDVSPGSKNSLRKSCPYQ